jgi:hypothetical protein
MPDGTTPCAVCGLFPPRPREARASGIRADKRQSDYHLRGIWRELGADFLQAPVIWKTSGSPKTIESTWISALLASRC